MIGGYPGPLPGSRGDVVRGDAEFLAALVDRDIKLARGETEPAGEQLEGQLDRPLLEIVIDRPAAQHLEERQVMPVTDVGDVDRPHARLDVAQVGGRRQRLAEEVGLERGHAGIDEEQRRVVHRDDGGSADLQMLPAGEELDECLADLVAAGGPVHAVQYFGPGRRWRNAFPSAWHQPAGAVPAAAGGGCRPSSAGLPSRPRWATRAVSGRPAPRRERLAPSRGSRAAGAARFP